MLHGSKVDDLSQTVNPPKHAQPTWYTSLAFVRFPWTPSVQPICLPPEPAPIDRQPDLQAALSAGLDGRLHYFAFDLVHLNGWDLRPCRLADRKRALSGLAAWTGLLRYADHIRTRRRKSSSKPAPWGWKASSASAPTRRIAPGVADLG
jgi:hypothetical protein